MFSIWKSANGYSTSLEGVVETVVYNFARFHGLDAIEREWTRLYVLNVATRINNLEPYEPS